MEFGPLLEEVADAIASYTRQRSRPRNLDSLRKNLREGPDGRFRWHWDPRFVGGEGPQELTDRARMDRAARALGVPTLVVRGRESDLLSVEGAEELLALLPELGSATAPTVPLPDEQRRFVLFDAVARALRDAARKRPLLAVFEDLHWADTASLRLLGVPVEIGLGDAELLERVELCYARSLAPVPAGVPGEGSSPEEPVRARIDTRSRAPDPAAHLFKLSCLIQRIAPHLHHWNRSVFFSVDQLARDTGWSPEFSFQGAVQHTWDWMRAEGLDRSLEFDFSLEDDLLARLGA